MSEDDYGLDKLCKKLAGAVEGISPTKTLFLAN